MRRIGLEQLRKQIEELSRSHEGRLNRKSRGGRLPRLYSPQRGNGCGGFGSLRFRRARSQVPAQRHQLEAALNLVDKVVITGSIRLGPAQEPGRVRGAIDRFN